MLIEILNSNTLRYPKNNIFSYSIYKNIICSSEG